MSIFNYEYTIAEASMKDFQKAKSRGERIHDQQVGTRIVDNFTRGHKDYKSIGSESKMNDLLDKYYSNEGLTKEEENKLDKLLKLDSKTGGHQVDLINNNKERTDRQKIRDSTRSTGGSVAHRGANPAMSRDADEKAVKRFRQSFRYKDIDIDETLKGMSKEKAAVVKRALEDGRDLPKFVKDKLVKKEDLTKKTTASHVDGGKKEGSTVTFKDGVSDEDKKKVNADYYKNLEILKTTRDPAEYSKAFKKLSKYHGFKNNKENLMWPEDGRMVKAKASNDDKIGKDDKIIHQSRSSKIKKLYSSLRAPDYVYYAKARVYGNKNFVGGRSGEKTDEDDGYNYYDVKDTNGKISKEDNESYDGARYFNTSRAVEVEKHSDKPANSKNKIHTTPGDIKKMQDKKKNINTVKDDDKN